MLSREDSRRLAQLERQLQQDDPEFCARMASGQLDPPRSKRAPLSLILTAVVLWIAAITLGVLGWWIAAVVAAVFATTVVVAALAHRKLRRRLPPI
ncbi:hypothetical protein Ade02nite_25510 [Paractinoplanes deccanensis]|uniref:DUF3040 domain-containing protein n=1 Tax=Paractinoplanes deccanensis TaxID=113561 RepID=A0ABQ3Y1Q6_9ACTN|nr:DUF3040 domain-containing protein [Actinoplanes deccanensis]GID73910.1 hypothetical protein Ade02nite_25510 [Actinoplanes deccanensis]